MSSGFSKSSDATPDQFEDDYYNSLQSLTFNSRPIIESHTNLAQENNNFAPQIVSAIEKRIEKAIPSQKLFTLYLLDSISKNIGLPYTSLFSNNIFKIFTRTYGLVDDQTRCKMIKLFKTWKIPTALTGLPLFDTNQLSKIEQFLIKVTASSNPGILYSSNDSNNNSNLSSKSSTPIQLSNNLSLITQPNLIKETDDLLILVNSRLSSVPNDEKGQQRFKLLNQLKSILSSNSSIPKNQLNEVAKQLQSIREDELLKLNILKQQQQQQQQQQKKQQQSLFSASQLQSLLNLSNNNNNNNNINQNNNNNNNNSTNVLFNMMSSVMNNSNIQQQQQQLPINQTQVNNPLGLKNMSFLEDMLKKTKGQQQSNSLSSSSLNNNSNGVVGSTVDFKFIRPTKKSIIEDFELNQTTINNHNPTSKEISLLYEFKPIQCNKCPKRFADSDDGKLLKIKHDEWHLRVEQRLKLGGSGLGGVVNRSWYLTELQWIEFDDYKEIDESINNNSNNNLNNNLNNNNNINNHNKNNNNNHHNKLTKNSDDHEFNSNNETKSNEFRDRDEKIDLADAPNHIVRIPESSSNEVICGICREKIVGTFDEDSGDWIWKNAVEQKGKVWHWTCWEETKRISLRRDRSPQR